MEPAPDMAGQAVGQRQARGGQGAAGHQPEALDDRRVQRQLELDDLFRRQAEGADLLEILGGVPEKYLGSHAGDYQEVTLKIAARHRSAAGIGVLLKA